MFLQKPNPISCITSSLTKPVIAVAVERYYMYILINVHVRNITL